MAEDLKKRFDTKIHSHFDVIHITRFLGRKAATGQLVRFTDVFGMAIGDALLTVCRNTFFEKLRTSEKGDLFFH